MLLFFLTFLTLCVFSLRVCPWWQPPPPAPATLWLNGCWGRMLSSQVSSAAWLKRRTIFETKSFAWKKSCGIPGSLCWDQETAWVHDNQRLKQEVALKCSVSRVDITFSESKLYLMKLFEMSSCSPTVGEHFQRWTQTPCYSPMSGSHGLGRRALWRRLYKLPSPRWPDSGLRSDLTLCER